MVKEKGTLTVMAVCPVYVCVFLSLAPHAVVCPQCFADVSGWTAVPCCCWIWIRLLPEYVVCGLLFLILDMGAAAWMWFSVWFCLTGRKRD